MTLVLLTESPGGLLFRPSLPVWAVGGSCERDLEPANMMIEDSLHDCCSPPASFHYFIIS